MTTATVTTAGQLGGAIVAGVGLFLLVPLAVFLLVLGVVMVLVFYAIEHVSLPDPTKQPDEPDADGA